MKLRYTDWVARKLRYTERYQIVFLQLQVAALGVDRRAPKRGRLGATQPARARWGRRASLSQGTCAMPRPGGRGPGRTPRGGGLSFGQGEDSGGQPTAWGPRCPRARLNRSTRLGKWG